MRPKLQTPKSRRKKSAEPKPQEQALACSKTIDWQVRLTLAVCGFLVIAVALIYRQTLKYDFVAYDDAGYVRENMVVKVGLTWRGIQAAFTQAGCSNWHPLTWISHMLDCQLYGLWAGGHHLTNVLLHAANAVILFLLLRQLTARLWPSAMVAALFALHPLHVQSVAWVAERKDMLSGLFFLLTLSAYAWYARRPFSLARYLAVMGLFALGLMSKPMLVALPAVLLLLDYWPLERWRSAGGGGRSWTFLISEKLPLAALSLASCCVTVVAQQGAIQNGDFVSWPWRIANALVAYASYLVQIFCPLGLAIFYPHPRDALPIWKIVAASLVLAGISAAAFAWRRERPYLFVGWLWYLGTLVPVIGLVQVGEQATADRYTYLTQVGIYVALAWTAADSLCGWRWRTWVYGAAAAASVAAMMACSWRETGYWENSETLFKRALACTTNNVVANANLGQYLADKGRFQEALVPLQEACRLDPNRAAACNNLGNALINLGRSDEGIVFLRKALALDPDYATAHYNLASVLAARKQTDEAIRHFRRALEIQPDYVKCYNNLAKLFSDTGQADAAIACWQAALKIDPEFATAHFNLSAALRGQGRFAEAIAQLREALRLPSDDANRAITLNRLAWMLATTPDASVRNGPEAIVLARQAIDISAPSELLGNTLAAAYAEAGQFDAAVQTAEEALKLALSRKNKPLADDLRARLNLYKAGVPFRDAPPKAKKDEAACPPILSGRQPGRRRRRA